MLPSLPDDVLSIIWQHVKLDVRKRRTRKMLHEACYVASKRIALRYGFWLKMVCNWLDLPFAEGVSTASLCRVAIRYFHIEDVVASFPRKRCIFGVDFLPPFQVVRRPPLPSDLNLESLFCLLNLAPEPYISKKLGHFFVGVPSRV